MYKELYRSKKYLCILERTIQNANYNKNQLNVKYKMDQLINKLYHLNLYLKNKYKFKKDYNNNVKYLTLSRL